MSAASGLDGLWEPLSPCLDAESARRLVDLQIGPVQERIDALAERANEGKLSDREGSKYEAMIHAADCISILKLKAPTTLTRQLGNPIGDGCGDAGLGPPPAAERRQSRNGRF